MSGRASVAAADRSARAERCASAAAAASVGALVDEVVAVIDQQLDPPEEAPGWRDQSLLWRDGAVLDAELVMQSSSEVGNG